MKRKLLLILMTILISLFAFSTISVSAATSGTCGTNLKWTVDDSGTLTISGDGNMKSYNSISALPWYSQRANIKKLVIGENVTSISKYAFHSFTALTEVNWNAKSVADFQQSDIVFYKAGQSGDGINVIFGNSVEKIPAYMFYTSSGYSYAPKVTNVTIGNNVISIGNYAFGYCRHITTINWNAKAVTDFAQDNYIFYMAGLSKDGIHVTFGDNVERIPTRAFYSCSMNGPKIIKLTFGKNVTTVGNYAFYDCGEITEINWNAIKANNFVNYNYVFSNAGKESSGINVTFGSDVESVPGYIFNPNSSSSTAPNITKVTFSNSVKNIGQNSFRYCTGLTKLDIPTSVSTIETGAFSNCSNLTGVYISDLVSWCKIDFMTSSNPLSQAKKLYLNNVLVTNLTIPSTVTSIKDNAFYGCSSITSVSIPNNVTSIGKNVFSGCSSLSTVNIGDGVTSMGSYAFSDCTTLSDVTIGNKLIDVGIFVFNNCKNIKNVYISNLVNWCKYVWGYDGNPLQSGAKLYLNGNLVSSLAIPNGITEIKDCAFYGCSSITSVSIPNGVTIIGGRAFQKCANIKSISLPSTLTTIDSVAFADCSSLQSITIPNSVTTINNDAFSCCESLTSITIPSSVKTLGGSAFYNCKNLQQINWNAINITDFGYYDSPFSGVGMNTSGVKVVIGNGVKRIPAYAFASSSSDISKITSVTISNTVTEIGISAFSGCKNLASVTIPNGVVSIGECAFSDCSSLKSVSIPNSVTSLGHSVFSNCTELNNVILGNSIDAIHDRVFYGCTSLTNITIPESVTAFELYAFANSGLKNITIPGSVSTIGRYAFLGCTDLSVVTIASGVNIIGEYAFSDCESLTDISIPNSVTTIDECAFRGCNSLTRISFGSGVTNIGGYSLCYCENLQEIVVNNNNQYYSSADGVLFDKEKTELICYPPQKGGVYCIPNGVTSISESAFYNCINLESITIPQSVTEIGNYAFRDCTAVTEINWNASIVSDFSSNNYVFYNTGKNGKGISLTFGNGVNKIPSYAFYPYSNYSTYSPKITTVTLPEAIKSIGSYAFQYCSNIKTVNYNGDSSAWNKISIGSYNSYLSNASRRYFYYVTLYDKDNNIISSKVQNKGEIVDTSAVGSVPIGYNIILYKNNELTEEYSIDTPINENLNLYVDIYHPLLNKVKITGMNHSTIGDKDIKYALTLSTDKDVNALYCFVKYPETLKLKSAVAKDFAYVSLEDEYTEDSFTTAVILAQYSETELIPQNAIHTPFELTFDVSKSAEPGTVQIEATEESCLIGNDTYFFEETIPGTSEILPKLAEIIEISGADMISTETTYNAIISPDYTTDKSVEWSIDNEEVATVDETGVVTPVTSGTFILTATAKDGSGVTASKTITVTRGVTNIEISGTDSITEATSYSVIITPDYATNKEVEWSISNSEIATIDQNGLVTPITSGIVIITATSKDGSGISASKEINIIKLAESIVITGEDSISSPAQYTATVSPDYTSDKEVKWSVDNEKIATVDDLGIVTPVTSGTIILTATAKDGSGVVSNKTIEIVKLAESIEIVGSEEINEPSQYSVVILPEYTTNKNAEWTVSDETIATVDENGLVTPLKNGKIVLTAKALDASGIETTKSIVITVSVRANSITSDIGAWDKEFDSDITEYTINVPSGTTAIYLTSSFENATAKVNGSVALNGVRKKVILTGAETEIELILTPTAGNTLSTNTYKITVVCGSFTKTTVSEDGKSFTIVPINIENGKTVILALYDGETFVEMQAAIYEGGAIPFNTTKTYTNAKVMVWEDLVTLKPICNVEIVK